MRTGCIADTDPSTTRRRTSNVMQQIFSIMTVATVLATTSLGDPGNAGIATTSPVTVSACAIDDLYNPALLVEFGPPINYRSLSLTFRNTDDVVATQVEFDVSHGGEHRTVIDRGRFSKGVVIEHRFDDEFADGYTREPDTCVVASIIFGDGRRWAARAGRMAPLTLR